MASNAMNPNAQFEQLLDINYLRSFGVEPAYFGLGFIQLKIQEHKRLHFYHGSLPVLVEEPHDHRYNFISYIMQGVFEQTIYGWQQDPDGEHQKFWEDCKPNSVVPAEPERGRIWDMIHTEQGAGTHYQIYADTLHTVRARENCITYLVRQPPFKDYAAVVRKDGAEKVCPFSQPIPVDQCWEMIEDMLPQQLPHPQYQLPTVKKNPGYHLVKIPKGKVGEPTKIIEEAYEIQDAHEQGVRVMTHVEMSDLYGALDRFRELHYPEVSMSDLEAMYRVTRRAFENKRR